MLVHRVRAASPGGRQAGHLRPRQQSTGSSGFHDPGVWQKCRGSSVKSTPQKLRAYEILFTLNQAFEQVLANLRSLQKVPFFRSKFLQEFQVMVEETRACINFELVETMHSREQDDWARFGRLRQKWEKRYRDPNDVLIEAERLKKKLRKSAGKRGKGGSHA